MEKSWNLKIKNCIIKEKSWNFVKYFDETTSSQKTNYFSGYLGFQVLIIAKCMHGLQA